LSFNFNQDMLLADPTLWRAITHIPQWLGLKKDQILVADVDRANVEPYWVTVKRHLIAWPKLIISRRPRGWLLIKRRKVGKKYD